MNNQKLNSPTLTAVELLADKKEVDPVNLQPPLHNVVDTEALDKVIQSLDENGYVEFQYLDYQIKITSSGEVEVMKRV